MALTYHWTQKPQRNIKKCSLFSCSHQIQVFRIIKLITLASTGIVTTQDAQKLLDLLLPSTEIVFLN